MLDRLKAAPSLISLIEFYQFLVVTLSKLSSNNSRNLAWPVNTLQLNKICLSLLKDHPQLAMDIAIT